MTDPAPTTIWRRKAGRAACAIRDILRAADRRLQRLVDKLNDTAGAERAVAELVKLRAERAAATTKGILDHDDLDHDGHCGLRAGK
jgi:hypothetical protein